MKNLFYFFLGAFIVWYWQKKKNNTNQGTDPQAPAEPAPANLKNANLGTDMGPELNQVSQSAIIGVLRVYGNTNNPSGNQDLILDILPEDAGRLYAGQMVSLQNSITYPGYYKILDITDQEPGKKAVRLQVIYKGSEMDIYIDTTKTALSPFSRTLKTKTPFL